jgi:hypothetical protein
MSGRKSCSALCIRCVDSGGGFPSAELEALTVPFTQVKRRTAARCRYRTGGGAARGPIHGWTLARRYLPIWFCGAACACTHFKCNPVCLKCRLIIGIHGSGAKVMTARQVPIGRGWHRTSFEARKRVGVKLCG